MSTSEAIKRVEAAEAELRLAKKALEPEVTYSVGDRFKDNAGNKKILVACIGNSGYNTMFSSLKNGHGSGLFASDWCEITPKELKYVARDWTRYWDSVKKEYTDGR